MLRHDGLTQVLDQSELSIFHNLCDVIRKEELGTDFLEQECKQRWRLSRRFVFFIIFLLPFHHVYTLRSYWSTQPTHCELSDCSSSCRHVSRRSRLSGQLTSWIRHSTQIQNLWAASWLADPTPGAGSGWRKNTRHSSSLPMAADWSVIRLMLLFVVWSCVWTVIIFIEQH